MKKGLELGIYTLGDNLSNSTNQKQYSQKERLSQIVELAKLSEQAGFDIFHVGESHQKHFVSQAHLVILAAISQVTKKIRLASAATVISVADPVRVYEAAATIDLLSNGRMELVCGRSARAGIYEVFGYELVAYDDLFEEKFDLLKQINQREVLKWSGLYRSELDNVLIHPRAQQEGGLPLWRASSGSIQSIERAAALGDSLYIVHPRGNMNTLTEMTTRYRDGLEKEGHPDAKLGLAGYLFVDQNGQKARDLYYPAIKKGSEDLFDYTWDRQEYDKAASKDSFINIGEPEFIVEKILDQHERLGMDRYIGHMDFAGMDFEDVKRSLYLLGDKVLPQVKKYSN
ncbi:TPA: LLM class flavin-dependent oxidoreductase [Streptococcus suis]